MLPGYTTDLQLRATERLVAANSERLLLLGEDVRFVRDEVREVQAVLRELKAALRPEALKSIRRSRKRPQ